jgi:hypothetical protein
MSSDQTECVLCSHGLVLIGHGGAIAISCTGNGRVKGSKSGFSTPDSTFENGTGLKGSMVFTGENSFTVKKLESYELVPYVRLAL